VEQYSFEVNRGDLGANRIVELPPAESINLEVGQAILSVERFALTANNITYGVAGDMIGYWQFFPAEGDWGRIPVWGVGTVTHSNHPDLKQGDRYYGYFPMSSYLVVTAAEVSGRGFTDVSAHRSSLPVVYNQYALMTPENGFDPAFDDHQMVYRPLFTTSFVIDDWLAHNDLCGAEKVMQSSAASKTSFGLDMLLHRYRPVEVVGLTSRGNLDFVDSTGVYDEIVTYADLEMLDASAKVAFVDMAGNRKVLEHLHHHFGDNIVCSSGVGITHWSSREGQAPATLPGAKPEMFFAPSQIQKRNKDWGPEKFQQELAKAWSVFLDEVDTWVTINHPAGPEAMTRTFNTVRAGAKPDQAYVVSL